jgi:membrane-bound lytic murein transglycosylase B
MALRRIIQLLTIASLSLSGNAALANSQSFDAWLADFRGDAEKSGISDVTLNEALSDIDVLPSVIKLDRKQPESTKTFSQYMRNVVNDARINRAIREFEAHRDVLGATGKRYGVQPEYIVALWAIESNFGERMGNFNVVEALATLAYDGRRSSYFRGELMNALKIIDAGHIGASEMRGSWAGAMGQCQFMPSSFLTYAVDADGDGKKNIWGDSDDVFASIANYLSTVGWNEDANWGVKANANKKLYIAHKNKKHSLSKWRAFGVTPTQETIAEGQYALISGNGSGNGPYFLVGVNYDNILKWNRSRYFAVAVGTLADSIVAGVSNE